MFFLMLFHIEAHFYKKKIEFFLKKFKKLIFQAGSRYFLLLSLAIGPNY